MIPSVSFYSGLDLENFDSKAYFEMSQFLQCLWDLNYLYFEVVKGEKNKQLASIQDFEFHG